MDEYLILASKCGQLEVVKHLIENGADVHTRNNHALQRASYNGHLGVVECLIKHGADANTNKYQ